MRWLLLGILLLAAAPPKPIFIHMPPPPHLKAVLIDGHVYHGYRIEIYDVSDVQRVGGIVIIDPLRPIHPCRITHRKGRWFCK